MDCPSCGRPSSPGAAFCVACGADLVAPPGAAAPAGAPAGMPAIAPPRAPLQAVEAVTSAFSLAFGNLGAFLATQGVFIVVAAALNLVLTLAFVLPGMDTVFTAVQSEDVGAILGAAGPLLALALLAGAAGFVLSVVGTGVGIVVADGLLRGERPTLGAAWSRLRPRLGNLVVTSLLVLLAAMGVLAAGFLLFFLIVPVFAALAIVGYLLVRWAVWMPVSVLEERSATQNLNRAGELTAGSRGAIFGAAVLLFLAYLVPSFVVGAIFGLGFPDAFDPAVDPIQAWEQSRPATGVLVAETALNTLLQLAAGFVTTSFLVGVYRRIMPEPAPPAPLAPTAP